MTQRRGDQQFTPLELELMKALWELGPATVQEVHQRIQASRPLAYNTVQTVLNILHRKGKVRRATQGRAYVYEPLVTQERAAGHAVGDLIDRLFAGKADALVLSMVKSRRLKAGELAALRAIIDEAESGGES